MTASTQRARAPAQARRLALTVVYYMAFVALGLVTASLGPTISFLAERTGAALSEVSVLFTAHSLGYLLGSLVSGWLYDRVAGHPVMGTVLVVMAAMMILVPTISALWLLFAVILIVGAAGGAVDVGGNALLVWVYGSQVGPVMNALHFFFGVGAFLSPIIIAQIMLRTDNLSWAYGTLAALVVPAAVWILRLRSPNPQGSSEEGSANRSNLGLVVLFVAFFFLYVGAEISFGGWIYTYGVALGLTGGETAAYLTSAFWGALTVGRLLASPIAARFRPRAVLLGDLIVCVASAVLVLLWPRSLIALWAGSLGMGLGMASVFPTMISWAEQRMPVTGKVTGWFLIGGSAGGMWLPWLIGQLFESIGPSVTMIAIGVDLIAAIAVWAVIVLGTKRSSAGYQESRGGFAR